MSRWTFSASNVAVAVFAAAISSCGTTRTADGLRSSEIEGESPSATASEEPHTASEPRGRFVLVTIDGVRWQEIFEGSDPRFFAGAPQRRAAAIAPNLHRLATDEGGVLGAPEMGTISATGPHFVSLPG